MSISRFEAIKKIIEKKNTYTFQLFGESCRITYNNIYYSLYMSGSLIDTASNIDKFRYVLIAK